MVLREDFKMKSFKEKIKNIIRSRTSIATSVLVIYYYFLWQFDHHIAPFVWIHKGDICMVIFILAPIIVYLTWSFPIIKKILRRNKK